MFRVPSVVVTAVLVGCASAPKPVTNERDDVVATASTWGAAFNECNPQKLAALYLPDAVLWGTVSQTVIAAPAGVRQYFERACATAPQFKIAFGEQLVRVYGDTAINSGTYIASGTVNGRAMSIPARYSFTYRKVGGSWLIADHHSSLVPQPPAPASASTPTAR